MHNVNSGQSSPQLGVYMQYTSSFYCCVGREASNIYVKECHHFGIIIMVARAFSVGLQG
jgi:hypothetical protein